MLPIIHKILRKDKKKGDKCAVVIQIYFNKERKQMFTGLYIEPELWDKEREEANRQYHDFLHFNRMLKNKVEQLEKDYSKQELITGSISIQTKTKHSRQSYFDYANNYYDGLKNTASEVYIGKCKTAIRDFKSFAGELNFQGVTPQILKYFEDHLFSIGRARNTINFVFKKIKQPFDHANKHKDTDHNPFAIFHAVTYKQTKRKFLTMEQVKEIEKVELPQELEYIRSYFLLGCYTGLRFSDLQKFDKKKSIVVNGGVERIIIGTTKTNEVVSIKLSNHVKGIIKKLDKKLPTNVHTNRLLKIISKKAGIGEISFHTSRHAAAVNMASAGLSMEVVARILGHTNIRTTAIYFKITDSKLDEAMDKWDSFMK